MPTAPYLDLDDEAPKRAEREGPAPYPEGDDEDESVYAAYARALWDEQDAGLEKLHRAWVQALLFLSGQQWWQRDELRGTWGPKKVPDWREQPVANFCISHFKHVLAKLTKERPAFQSIAASTEPDDIHAAELADDALRAKWQELRLSRTLRRACAWLIATGNAYLLPYWHTETGKLSPLVLEMEMPVLDEAGQVIGAEVVAVPCDERGEPILDGDGQPDLSAEPAWVDEGEIAAKVPSPFQVRVDSGAECDEDVSFTLIGEVVALRDLRRRWPEAAGRVSAEDVGMLDQYERVVHQAGAGPDTQVVSGGGMDDEHVPRALVLHYHEKPCAEYPKGRYWASAGSVLLEEPQPLPDDVWPVVVHLKDIEVPGRYHGMATMEPVVGLNREYNEVNALIKEHHNLLLRGKWLVPIGSNIRRGQITNQPGEVIQHTPGLPPRMADLKPLPNAVYQERERIKSDFQTISGINRISMGQPPPGVTSGRAFLTLQEADDTDIGPLLATIEESVAALAWAFLKIMQRRYDEERLIRVSGEDRRYQVRAFKGSDLEGVVDVVPQSGSAFPWSKTAKQSALIEIAQAMPFLFEDPETGGFDRHRFAELLPVAGLDSLHASADADLSEALREEDDFRDWDGDPETPLPQPTPWQDLSVHDRQHTRQLKSASFQQWEPHAQQAFLHHWQETRDAIQMQMQQQMQAQREMESGAAPPELSEGERPGEGAPAP